MEKNTYSNYHDEINKKNILHLREILDSLPPFCKQYFMGVQEYISTRTRVAYAYDIRVFFEYLHDTNPVFKKTPIVEYKIDILDKISRLDIEEYLEYCSYYIKDGNEFIALEDVQITQDSTLDDIKKHNTYMLYSQYLPVINSVGGLTPSTLYLDNMECFAVVRAKNGNSILWEQPIVIV